LIEEDVKRWECLCMNVLRVFFFTFLWLEEASFPSAKAPETSDFLQEFPLGAITVLTHP